ncbi:MAG: hypothetical protein RIE31_07005 [Alphaproteobacteria bacterium]
MMARTASSESDRDDAVRLRRRNRRVLAVLVLIVVGLYVAGMVKMA